MVFFFRGTRLNLKAKFHHLLPKGKESEVDSKPTANKKKCKEKQSKRKTLISG